MTANSGNVALGIGQTAGTAAAASGEAVVACAIYCCDKEKYNLPNSRGGRKTCQRIASRKHSCVLHKLRVKKNGKLTQQNKFSNVLASPRYDNVVSRRLIPDTIVDNVVIDAKFPCSTTAVHKVGWSPPKNVYPTDGRSGMMGKKELREYGKIKNVKDVKAMSPADAAKKKGANCKC